MMVGARLKEIPVVALPFASPLQHADTLIPQPGNLLAWDRYGYAYNNPVIYNDPSGHCVDGLTTIPCLMALIAVTGFFGGAAIYEFNVSGNSWWESKDDTIATVNAGIEGTLVTVGMALTAGQIALIMPEAAMYIGAKSNNVSLFSWGATQNGFLQPIVSENTHKKLLQ